MSTKISNTPNYKKSKAPLFISLGIVAAIMLAYFFIPAVNDFLQQAWNVLTSNDEERINKWVAQFGFWGPFIIVLIMILQMFLIVIPTPVLMMVTIIAYGPVWGSLICLIAIIIASSVGYFVGRYFASVVFKLLGAKTTGKIKVFLEEYGFRTVVIIRLNPLLSNDAISFVGGMLKMNYFKFMAATLLGIIPLIALMAFFRQNYDQMESGILWVSVVLLLFFAAFVWFNKKRKKNGKKTE